MVRKEHTARWILFAGLILIMMSPFVLQWKVYFPYIVPRAAYFQLAVEIFFIAACIFFLWSNAFRPQWSFVALAFLAYLVINALTTATGIDPSRSFTGSIERSFGYLHLLHYGLLFFIAKVALHEEKHWEQIFTASLFFSVIPALDVFLKKILMGQMALTTIFGNPLFLAAYLLIHFFLAIHLYRTTHHRALKITFASIAGLHLLILLALEVRAAYLGLAAATVIFFIWCFAHYQQWRKTLTIVAVLMVAGYSVLLLNRNAFRSNVLIQRITNFSSQESTIQSRFIIWKSAWKGFLERPMLGWGRENFANVFNIYFDPNFEKLELYEKGEIFQDRAHNIILDELITGGILGLLGFGFLIGAMAAAFRKHFILISLIVAYFIQNLFGVENLNSFIFFTLLLAYGDFLTASKKETKLSAWRLSPAWLSIISIVTTIAMGIAAWHFTIRPYNGVRAIYAANAYHATLKLPEFQQAFDRALALMRPDSYRYQEMLGLYMTAVIAYSFPPGPAQLYLPYLDIVLEPFEKVAAREPFDERWVSMLGKVFYLEGLIKHESSYLDRASAVFANLIKRSPDRGLYARIATSITQTKATFQ